MSDIVVSISPLCPEKDAVFEPAPVGTWIESPSTRYVFSKLGENAYKIDVINGNDRLTMTGRFIRLDGILFVDAAPSGMGANLGVPDKAAEILEAWYVWRNIPAPSRTRPAPRRWARSPCAPTTRASAGGRSSRRCT